MINTSFIKKFLLALTVVFLYSCDKDFNAIGDGLIGDDHFGLEPEQYEVLAFNQEVTPVQSNLMPANALGIYDNVVFGTTTANFVTQVALGTYAPTIGESPVIESAVLTIPYFIKSKTTDAEGASTYVLDSIYGDKTNGKLDLKVYESGIQMRNAYLSGGSQLPQFYYTDQNNEFETKKLGNHLNDTLYEAENTKFFFDPKEIVTKTIDADTKKEVITRTEPQMVLHLNKGFFQEKILNAPASKLASDDVFQEYFRGVYFNVARSASSPSNLALLNFGQGKITINYRAKTASTTDDPTLTEKKQIVLNLMVGSATANSAATANFLQNVRNPEYEAAITTNVNKTEGDEKLYVKGGQGSAAVIRLTGFASQLAAIRDKNWKVNEANLVFYIDADKMAGTDEPVRMYLYDLTNNTVLADYSTEAFGGVINKGTDKRGKTYKFRITSHIRNLIKNTTAENVDLGLVISQSSATIAAAPNVLKNKIQIQNDPVRYFSQVPRGSVMSTLGTVLYGGKASAGDKRLKLEVYYTKPN